MWPFSKKPSSKSTMRPPEQISFSQVDTTERFGDNIGLQPDEWIPTIPLNSVTREPESMGLPSVKAADDEVFEIASRLSRIRESIPIRDDGVYCAICHIACIDLGKLRTPCPQCGRELLKFGWD